MQRPIAIRDDKNEDEGAYKTKQLLLVNKMQSNTIDPIQYGTEMVKKKQ